MRFQRIYVEITNVCNLNCRMCPNNKRLKQTMSVDLFAHILKEICGYTGHLYLHVTGEPLLHPQLEALLTLTDQYGLQVNVVTNGTLIHQAGRLLLRHRSVRQIHFSVHSIWESGRQDEMETYLQRLFQFADEARQNDRPWIAYRVWTNGGKIQDAAVSSIIAHYGTSHVTGNAQRIPLATGVFLNFDTEFQWPDASKIPTLDPMQQKQPKFCYGMRTQCAILTDGTVVPCCLDSEGTIALGNIQKQNFVEIISCDRAKRLYQGFTAHTALEPLCQTCGFRIRREKNERRCCP